jgi:arylsulfatase A-like enzyme
MIVENREFYRRRTILSSATSADSPFANPDARREHPIRTPTAAFLALLLAFALAACDGKTGRAVVLISLDTLRQDHLGCYGYGRDTSPNIDRFAREDAVVFEAAYAQAPYTLPSHMSIFTGLYPEAHGVLTSRVADATRRVAKLPSGIPTLGEAFKAQGFRTTAFTDGFLVSGKYGFARGFDEYRDEWKRKLEDNGFRKFGKAVLRWIRWHSDEDFLLFIHTYDTHSPYPAPEPFRSRFANEPPGRELPPASMIYASLLDVHDNLELQQYESLQDLVDVYDGSIAFVDHEVGKIFDLLKREGLWEDAVIAITSDHGERFLENGLMIGHGLGLSNEEVLIPLILKLPGSAHAGQRVDHIVESVDIMPTLLAAVGIPEPPDLHGQNLIAGLEEGRWKKNHAFGVSPNGGLNHYLVRDGVKFVEAFRDPERSFVLRHLKPMILGTMKPPPARISKQFRGPVKWEDLFYRSPELDPLGAFELLYRGDELYDLRTAHFEWRAEPIRDRERLREWKDATYALADRAVALGERYAEDVGATGSDEPDEDLEALKALGYVGLLDNAISPADLAKDAAPPEVEIAPPRTDRTLLDRGDRHLWRISRYLKNSGERSVPARFEDDIEQARALYLEFERRHPDRDIWVYWRLRSLALAQRNLREK